MKRPKLILINGFAASGKTTISKMYIDHHPLAVMVEGDELVVNIGGWQTREDEARKLVFEMTKSMIRPCLESGHDIILPYLVTDASHVEEFKLLSESLSVDFYEFVLRFDRKDAIVRLLKRGTWGEVGQPPITDQDLPAIENLADKMEAALQLRPDAVVLNIEQNDPVATYKQLMSCL